MYTSEIPSDHGDGFVSIPIRGNKIIIVHIEKKRQQTNGKGKGSQRYMNLQSTHYWAVSMKFLSPDVLLRIEKAMVPKVISTNLKWRNKLLTSELSSFLDFWTGFYL